MNSIKVSTIKKSSNKDTIKIGKFRCSICDNLRSDNVVYYARMYFGRQNGTMGVCQGCAKKSLKKDKPFAAKVGLKYLT